MSYTCWEFTWECVGWQSARLHRNPFKKVNLFWNVLSESAGDTELLTNGFNISFNDNRMMDSSAGWIRLHVNSSHRNEKGLSAGRRALSHLNWLGEHCGKKIIAWIWTVMLFRDAHEACSCPIASVVCLNCTLEKEMKSKHKTRRLRFCEINAILGKLLLRPKMMWNS